jgi:hypothetical protein
MTDLSLQAVQDYRQQTYHLKPGQRLGCIEDAINFVQERGFVYFWPIKGVELPSLWTAAAGERPVADAHDDPGHITWGWKDDALGKRFWYYAKVLRKKATMIDLEVAPYFYALSENYGDAEEDVLIAYHEGRMTLEAKSIFDFILDNGPMDTIAIRRGTHMTSKESNSRFERALALLQADFKILPVGISDAGAWRYAFIYDLVHRHYPQIPEAARHIKEKEARHKLAELYFQSVGAAQFKDMIRLFGWRKIDLEKTIIQLIEEEILVRTPQLGGNPGDWIAIKKLL